MKRLSLLLAGVIALGHGSSVWAANAYTTPSATSATASDTARRAPETADNAARSATELEASALKE